MKKYIIYSFLGGFASACILIAIGSYCFIIRPLKEYIHQQSKNEQISLCENTQTVKLINDSIQNVINITAEKYLSNYYHKFPTFKVDVSIIHNSVITKESNPKYASCQATLLIDTNINKVIPLKLEFYSYNVRLSDNKQRLVLMPDMKDEEMEDIVIKIQDWMQSIRQSI